MCNSGDKEVNSEVFGVRCIGAYMKASKVDTGIKTWLPALNT